MNEPIKKQSGVILLLAIMVIAAVLGTSAMFGALVLSDLKQSRLIDQSIQAFYLAESGAEKALYQVRRREAIKPADCGLIAVGSVCQDDNGYCSNTIPAEAVSCLAANQGSLNWSKGDWQIIVSNEKEFNVFLNQGEAIQLDLFNPYQRGESISQIESFMVSASSPTVLYGELTNLSWLLGGTLNCPLPPPAQPAISRNFITLLGDGSGSYASTGYLTAVCDQSINPDCLPLNPNCAYILRLSNNVLSPMGGGLTGQFNVSIYNKATDINPEADQLDIPSRLMIYSSAVYGSSYQKIKVRTPVRPPLAGLYDFVLFSELPIVKQ